MSEEIPPPKKRGPKPKLNPEEVAAALAVAKGNIAAVARKLNVDRHTIRDMIDARPTLKKVLDDAREGFLDDAESALYVAVMKRESWAVCFTLKTLGKKRGYIERTQVENYDGHQLELTEEIITKKPGQAKAEEAADAGSEDATEE